MRFLFKELIKGNVPEGFSVEKGNTHFFLYKIGNPKKEQIMAFNSKDVKSPGKESKCQRIFEIFGWRLNRKTKEWER